MPGRVEVPQDQRQITLRQARGRIDHAPLGQRLDPGRQTVACCAQRWVEGVVEVSHSIGVQSRHLVDRIDDEPVWLCRPDLGDVFVGGETAEGLEPAGEVVGGHEVSEVRPELVVALIVEASDGRFLDGPVHPLDLFVGPRIIRFGEPMLDVVGLADHVEAHLTGPGGVPVAGLLGELDAVIGQDRVDAVGHGCQQVFEELSCCPAISLADKSGDREFARAVYADEQVELAFRSLRLGDTNMR